MDHVQSEYGIIKITYTNYKVVLQQKLAGMFPNQDTFLIVPIQSYEYIAEKPGMSNWGVPKKLDFLGTPQTEPYFVSLTPEERNNAKSLSPISTTCIFLM